MTKVNPNNGNETRSDILLWNTSKSDIIAFYLIPKFVSFMTKATRHGNETKSDIFP